MCVCFWVVTGLSVLIKVAISICVCVCVSACLTRLKMSIRSQPVILFPHIPSLCGTVKLQHARVLLTQTYLFTLPRARRHGDAAPVSCVLTRSWFPCAWRVLRAGWKHSR